METHKSKKKKDYNLKYSHIEPEKLIKWYFNLYLEDFRNMIYDEARKIHLNRITDITIDDLFQEAALKLFKTRFLYNPEKSALTTWTVNISRRVFLNICRHKVNNKNYPNTTYIDENGCTKRKPTNMKFLSEFENKNHGEKEYSMSDVESIEIFKHADSTSYETCAVNEGFEKILIGEVFTIVKSKLDETSRKVLDMYLNPSKELYREAKLSQLRRKKIEDQTGRKFRGSDTFRIFDKHYAKVLNTTTAKIAFSKRKIEKVVREVLTQQ